MLAEDKKSCVLLRTKAEIGKAGLIIAGVMGGVLIIVTVLGTIKYRQTKVAYDQKVKRFKLVLTLLVTNFRGKGI